MAYCTTTELNQLAGTANVQTWADYNKDGNTTANITAAIERADNEINDLLRDGPYAIPFSSVPTTIKWMSARIALYYLYSRRGFHDVTKKDSTGNQLKADYDMSIEELRQISNGRRRIDATRTEDGPRAPFLVCGRKRR